MEYTTIHFSIDRNEEIEPIQFTNTIVKHISFDRLIYLTENIDLDITKECNIIVVRDVSIETKELLLDFLKARVSYLENKKKIEYFIKRFKKIGRAHV